MTAPPAVSLQEQIEAVEDAADKANGPWRDSLDAAAATLRAIEDCQGDNWECPRCGHSEPWWTDSNADYMSRQSPEQNQSQSDATENPSNRPGQSGSGRMASDPSPPQDSDYPTVRCPKCKVEQVDMDGFGFLMCDACGHCTHPSSSGTPLKCDNCGKPQSSDSAGLIARLREYADSWAEHQHSYMPEAIAMREAADALAQQREEIARRDRDDDEIWTPLIQEQKERISVLEGALSQVTFNLRELLIAEKLDDDHPMLVGARRRAQETLDALAPASAATGEKG